MALFSVKERETQVPVFEQERERLEYLSLEELQLEMCNFISSCLADPERREQAVKTK